MRHHWLSSWLDGLCHQDTGRKMSWQTTMWKLSKDSTSCGSDTLTLTQGRHHSLRDMYYNSSQPKKKRHLNVVTIYRFLTESPNPLWSCCEGIICVDIYNVLQKEIPNTLIFKWITFCLRKKSASVLLHYRNLHQSVRLFFLCSPCFLVFFGFQQFRTNLSLSYNPGEIGFLHFFCLISVIC